MITNNSKRGVGMLYKDFYLKVREHMADYKVNVLGIVENGKWLGQEKSHILPYTENNMLKQFLPEAQSDYLVWGIPKRNEKIKLHMYAAHLNSSQVMCINYFAPFLQDEAKQKELICILNEMGLKNLDLNAKIVEASFEKVFDEEKDEGTNFDFYIKLDDNSQIFFEIKYTEYGMGKTHADNKNPEKYPRKWKNVYIQHLEKSKLLKEFANQVVNCENYKKIDFYKDYQICRNISYIRKDNDYVVFLTSEKNLKTENELNDFMNKHKDFENVFYFKWEKLLEKSLNCTKDIKIINNLSLFKTKYIDIKIK